MVLARANVQDQTSHVRCLVETKVRRLAVCGLRMIQIYQRYSALRYSGDPSTRSACEPIQWASDLLVVVQKYFMTCIGAASMYFDNFENGTKTVKGNEENLSL
jgi:hypothetical protein